MAERSLQTQLSGIRAIVLDVDDTIVDTRAAMVVGGAEGARALWPSRPELHLAMAKRYFDDPGGWFRRYAAGELRVEQMRIERLREVATAFGLELPVDAHDTYLQAYVPAFRSSARLFDDVPAMLAAADDAAIPVALLTNSTQVDTALKLEALELGERFEGLVVTTDTLGYGKPEPRVYLEACRLLASDPRRTVCIGDSLEWDVVGATAAGLRGIWLDRAGAGTTTDVVTIETLHAITHGLVASARSPVPLDLGRTGETGSIPSRFTSQKALGRARE